MTQLQLFAFPSAGANVSLFNGWQSHLPSHVRLKPVGYPGRGAAHRQPIPETLLDLVEQLARDLAPVLTPPFAFFGHSLGATVAFELARKLRRSGGPLPSALVLASRRAPHLPDSYPPVHRMSDAQVIDLLRLLGGTPQAVLADDELLSYFLPIARDDFKLLETHATMIEPALAVPITALCGLSDPRVRPEDMADWREQTTLEFRFETFPGGHFFINTATDAMLRSVDFPQAP